MHYIKCIIIVIIIIIIRIRIRIRISIFAFRIIKAPSYPGHPGTIPGQTL
jgi:hypothetical protein